MALYFCNSFSSSLRKCFNLLFVALTWNTLTHTPVLGITKTNGLIVLSKYPIKYEVLVFVLTNFEITILSTSASEMSIGFFAD